jgi:hypothetical protein
VFLVKPTGPSEADHALVQDDIDPPAASLYMSRATHVIRRFKTGLPWLCRKPVVDS